MIASDFTQAVTIAGNALYVSDLIVQSSEDEPIDRIEFEVDREIQQDQALAFLIPGAECVVTQSADGTSMTWRGVVSNVTIQRKGHYDVFRVSVEGETEILGRIRFTEAFEGMTASEIVTAAAQKVGLSTAGIQTASVDIGDIISREDTALDVISKCAQRTGYSYYVSEGVMYFRAPGADVAPFAIEPGSTLIADTITSEADSKQIRNVVKAIAYDYREIRFEGSVRECTQSVYVAPVAGNYELSGVPVITSPDELSDVSVSVNPQTGRVEFGTPLVLDNEQEEFELRVAFKVRRPVLAADFDEASIATYGERHGQLQPEDGGDDIASVRKKLRSEIERKAYPTRKVSCQVARLGLYPGQVVDVSAGGAFGAQQLRVASVRHTTHGAELQIDVELTSVSYRQEDPVPELAARVANLERHRLHPNSISGRDINFTGVITAEEPVVDVLSLTGFFEVSLAALPKIRGAGAMAFNYLASQTREAIVAGGGALAFDTFASDSRVINITGGGALAFDSAVKGRDVSLAGGGALAFTNATKDRAASITGGGALGFDPVEPEEYTVTINGAGALSFNEAVKTYSTRISGAGALRIDAITAEIRETEDSSTRITESGDARVLEGE